MKKNLVTMLLAGGVGSRLNILAHQRAKPAIPFGALYRIIDFTLSNISNSGIEVAGVLTQYKPLSLMEHIDNGRPWDLFGRTRQVEILPPKTGEASSDWYKGTSDAVYQNLEFVGSFSPRLTLIVSGDHIYHMNYNDLIAFHTRHRAQVTICLIRVPITDAHHFGIATVNAKGRITEWSEKPEVPKSNLASMGIYLFNTDILVDTLNASTQNSAADFAKNIIPLILKKNRVFGFCFDGYWRDVGTIEAYWNTNMDMIRGDSRLDISTWGVKTNQAVKGEIGDRPSTYFGRSAHAENSIIARGCVIEGTVMNSIISPGVRIQKHATVSDSIVFHDTFIASRAQIKKSIIDKRVTIKRSTSIGVGKLLPNRQFPEHLYTGITLIGKNVSIGQNTTIGTNCIIYPGACVNDNHTSGATVH